ncbi:antitoxin of toxin-antitoxin system VapB [Rickettsia australis str. Cutlack]|uniref:Antitoxin of toxin-antitoxin system VapB n=1 Tax=Rickettsia australis (strain Cutlack) TaxID=1105110 RepID=H8K866_RICAC|nr:antitoxin of toxin-antitoxin system VapB [Rickettsia australis str. Cutlack]
MAQIIRATEFVRSFADIMNRVYYKGETFDVQKGNHIVARITPVHACS